MVCRQLLHCGIIGPAEFASVLIEEVLGMFLHVHAETRDLGTIGTLAVTRHEHLLDRAQLLGRGDHPASDESRSDEKVEKRPARGPAENIVLRLTNTQLDRGCEPARGYKFNPVQEFRVNTTYLQSGRGDINSTPNKTPITGSVEVGLR